MTCSTELLPALENNSASFKEFQAASEMGYWATDNDAVVLTIMYTTRGSPTQQVVAFWQIRPLIVGMFTILTTHVFLRSCSVPCIKPLPILLSAWHFKHQRKLRIPKRQPCPSHPAGNTTDPATPLFCQRATDSFIHSWKCSHPPPPPHLDQRRPAGSHALPIPESGTATRPSLRELYESEETEGLHEGDTAPPGGAPPRRPPRSSRSAGAFCNLAPSQCFGLQLLF